MKKFLKMLNKEFGMSREDLEANMHVAMNHIDKLKSEDTVGKFNDAVSVIIVNKKSGNISIGVVHDTVLDSDGVVDYYRTINVDPRHCVVMPCAKVIKYIAH